jgi:hypothetical protein
MISRKKATGSVRSIIHSLLWAASLHFTPAERIPLQRVGTFSILLAAVLVYKDDSQFHFTLMIKKVKMR